eukprot:CAMPEP_0116893178 /NCGR_PEP_ID=MMETSP0467-20121206/3231_1 /TAXON_ID=283647 /ORGANISM="Mesodinium pulex, Strain SPMC105" /LENGTH=62 /DNA_ID=CAMNT_0004562707 /DNA_START=1408 /DNA_END=1593 /DNA_ORIENTATION=+
MDQTVGVLLVVVERAEVLFDHVDQLGGDAAAEHAAADVDRLVFGLPLTGLAHPRHRYRHHNA